MSYIDKLWVSSHEEYAEFVNWIGNKTVKFFDGTVVKVNQFLIEWGENDFNGKELPLMNSPLFIDVWLIQNCPFEYIHNQLTEKYSQENIDKFKTFSFARKPKGYLKNRKIVIEYNNNSVFPLRCVETLNPKRDWILETVESNQHCFRFNEESGIWGDEKYFHFGNTNVQQFRTIAEVKKSLKKQYLPTGISFELQGYYDGQVYTVKIK